MLSYDCMLLEKIGFWLAHFLQKVSPGYVPASATDPDKLRAAIRPGDILLVEGNQRISIAIKYLTQSTWSHAAVYVGNGQLIEADLTEGVVHVPLTKYTGFHTRICRAVNLTEQDRQKLLDFLSNKLGTTYDMKNAIDLLRYFLPTPPVPVKWRRRMLALGSGDPTRAICSTLIAQAFTFIGYPILPVSIEKTGDDFLSREVMHIRHHSLYTPRDFDVSPYFQIIKPTIEGGFDYKAVTLIEQT